jgi:hypothetical protein
LCKETVFSSLKSSSVGFESTMSGSKVSAISPAVDGVGFLLLT